MTIKNRFTLDQSQSLLVVIDVQERLCAAMNPEVLAQLVRNTGILLDSALELSVPVIFTEQYVKGLGVTLSELKGRVPVAACHEKLSFSCCGNQDFVRQIKESGRKQIVICGMETHVCVLQTVTDLLGDGFNEDELKYDVILEKVREIAEEHPDEISSLIQALIEEESTPNEAQKR